MKKIILLFLLMPFLGFSQLSKIDIMNGNIHCYYEDRTQVIYAVDSTCNEFLNTFSDTQDLLGINISNPIKRIIKFYEIIDYIPKSSIELDYINMNSEQRSVLDVFINKFIH